MGKYIFLIFILLFSSCKMKEKGDSLLYDLCPSSVKKEIPIDHNTKIYTRALHHYEDPSGVEYISIEDSEGFFDYNTISFFRLDSCRLSHVVKIEKEGANGISSFMGHGVDRLDNIFIYGSGRSILYLIDDKGVIKRKYDFSQTIEGTPTTEFDGNSLVYKPLTIIGSKLYGTQFPLQRYEDIRGDDFDNIPLALTIDTCSGEARHLPLHFPRLWEKGGGMGMNAHCNRIYDGKNFIYTFRTQEDIIVTSVDHTNRKSYTIKSKYIDKLDNEGVSRDLSVADFNKVMDEKAIYGNFIYDKYRNVYYRFAYPACTIDYSSTNRGYSFEYIFCRKEFSVMIIDTDFNVIGETLFPSGKYAPGLFFVNKDGLYISENHTDNPNASEDLLIFRLFSLKEL